MMCYHYHMSQLFYDLCLFHILFRHMLPIASLQNFKLRTPITVSVLSVSTYMVRLWHYIFQVTLQGPTSSHVLELNNVTKKV